MSEPHGGATPSEGEQDPGSGKGTGAGADPVVEVSGLCKTYAGGSGTPVRACDEVDLRIEEGETVALTGPSGSGKSTLLYLLGALEEADAGTIDVAGERITALKRSELAAYRRRVGFVFQRFHLLPTLTALDNVIAPVLPYRVDFDRRTRARQLLSSVGLEGREEFLPSKLSGGQQQRVAVARALIGGPRLILADEPTGNLDSRSSEEVLDLLMGLRERHGTTVVIATHDPDVVARCDRVVQLRDGKVA
ncbi:ATP-binding cassette domain-containing protein [Streptomyces sp. NPDC005955]|uniref:ABC transporter ATP-binding protein n=1 Tax=Streptomyces sp. NPDC005955 TaxID=3364738 RepID=UPI0036C4060B